MVSSGETLSALISPRHAQSLPPTEAMHNDPVNGVESVARVESFEPRRRISECLYVGTHQESGVERTESVCLSHSCMYLCAMVHELSFCRRRQGETCQSLLYLKARVLLLCGFGTQSPGHRSLTCRVSVIARLTCIILAGPLLTKNGLSLHIWVSRAARNWV